MNKKNKYNKNTNNKKSSSENGENNFFPAIVCVKMTNLMQLIKKKRSFFLVLQQFPHTYFTVFSSTNFHR